MTTIEAICKEDVEKVFETPHFPTLVLLDNSKDKLRVMKLGDNRFEVTEETIEADKVGDFCYIEERLFFPLKRMCEKIGQKLTFPEIDTKILRNLYSNLNFDAYSFYPVGMGLNIDGMSRISGHLYKIKEGGKA
jgi:hypothetical protein